MNVLISVYNKENLNILIDHLIQKNAKIYSTGGTYKFIESYLSNKNINNECLINISEYTNFSEICNGRVKTLHPKIFGGILALKDNDNHMNDLKSIDGILFDLIVVNLYPFEDTIKSTQNHDEIIEQIDIGGHSLLRASIKNYKNVSTLCSPEYYTDYINNNISNLELAKITISEIMKYDIIINNWFQNIDGLNCNSIGQVYNFDREMKYGLNPYMKPSFLVKKNGTNRPFEILNGNPGYINLLDASNGIRLVLEIKKILNVNCCASYKHTSPAGVSISLQNHNDLKLTKNIDDFTNGEIVFLNTRNIDPKSSFGDFISYNGIVDINMAKEIKKYVSDGIIAYGYENDALQLLKTKKKGNYIVLKQTELIDGIEFRDINGTTLVQPSNNMYIYPDELLSKGIVSDIQIIYDMILGFITLKYTQSNCICFVYKGNVIGIGAGQQNRVDCIKLAGEKSRQWFDRNNISSIDSEIVLVSDAFMPFSDNVEVAHEYNVKYILQPGGSIRDDEVLECCNKYNIKMILSDKRVFTH